MIENKNLNITIYNEETNLEHQVDDKAAELSREIAKVENKSELDVLYDAFKINDTKKNVFRINKLNNLLDRITDEATARFEQRPGEMSNKEVIDYMNAVSNQIDRSKSTLNQIKDINLTQINNTVNVNIDSNKENTLSRESRERVIDFIKDILKTSENNGNSVNEDHIVETEEVKEAIDNNE